MKNQPAPNNYAFIDSQNLNLSISSLGWKLDYRRFRRYLAEKYHVTTAYLFLGFVEENNLMYQHLEEAGYVIVFKPTLAYKDGTTKGNVDAELVLQAMLDLPNYDQAIIVTGDGDFYCLIQYLLSVDKLAKALIPNKLRYSALLKRFPSEYLAFVSDLKRKLTYVSKRKEPRTDQPVEGASRGDSNENSTKSS